MNQVKIGDKFKSNDLIGEVKNINGTPRLVVTNKMGKITQTMSLSKIDISKFIKI